MEKTYLPILENFKSWSKTLPNTPMLAQAKINACIYLNMAYESQVMTQCALTTHPYLLVNEIVQKAQALLEQWSEIGFIEQPSDELVQSSEQSMENIHQDLFQQLWTKFSLEDYKSDRIARYVHRLRINGLGKPWLEGKKCIDFGCGHGSFGQALLAEGAEYVYGLDYGQESIAYAIHAREQLNIPESRITFKQETVYQVSQPDDSFDFAIQNGVFHHLEDEDTAYKEVWRVLKPGGWFWIYTDGSGGIGYDLWDASVEILKSIPHQYIISHLAYLNISTGKRYHLGDGLNAIYRHTSWNELTERLTSLGFGNFKRLIGGFPTDMDHDAIAQHAYGEAKFGEGDLRLLAQKIAPNP